MAKAVLQRPDLKLVFMGTTHPNPSIPKMRMLVSAHRLADELGLTGKHVFFRPGWVPYQQRHNFLADADIGVSLHFDHVETVYSFRTRVLDYLWAGLPMILTAGDEMADLAAAEGFGVVVNYEDPDGVAAALLRLAADSELRRSYGQRALEVSRRFRWGVVVEPLNRYCAAPCPSPDSVIRKQLTRREKRLRLAKSILVGRATAGRRGSASPLTMDTEEVNNHRQPNGDFCFPRRPTCRIRTRARQFTTTVTNNRIRPSSTRADFFMSADSLSSVAITGSC